MEIFSFLTLNLLSTFMLTGLVLGAEESYSEALLSLKSEIVDDSGALKDWSMPSEETRNGRISACFWSGVKCNKNFSTVIGLDLSNKSLRGSTSGKRFEIFTELVYLNLSSNSFSGHLPVGIFNLSNLKTMDISRNNFSGHFPNGASSLKNLIVLDAFSNNFSGPLPVDISQLDSLKVLKFGGSYFKGSIPPEYGSFKSIEFIHLAGNLLTGNIPPELGFLQTVTHMEIGYNSYRGSIPWQMGNMTELKYLDISGANLSGKIPKQLANLTKLESLFIFRNRLSGSIPWELSKISTLVNFDLSDNQISGSIPESFAELKNLRLLSLMNNQMGGTVPEVIAELPLLGTLCIWNNFFTGSLPKSLGKNSKLEWLDVSTNNFSGSVPPGICSGGVLNKLILFSNNFEGEISRSLSSCSSLVRLRIEDNHFSGEIPLNFSHLPDIRYVDLSRNKFTGGIPADISQAFNLQYFNVAGNPELGGVIPAGTWSPPLLQNFSASSCGILGDIPPFQSCKSLSVIEMSMNKISGSIPLDISKCRALERINLASNALSGHIPEQLAVLPRLSVLDLSHNNLTGSIPLKFGNSSSLLLLNVSFNGISGSIPPGKAFRLMGISSFLGNPRLCGVPLRQCPNDMRDGFGEIAWVLLLCAVVVLFFAMSVLGLYHFRRERKGQWKMISFMGLPQFTANDVLKSFASIKSMETVAPLSSLICKTVLPTGVTVSVKRMEWKEERMEIMAEFITRLGNARHDNLVKLLGLCYNGHLAYLLYDCLPGGNMAEKIRIRRDWASKKKIVLGIARGLCFLHHDCHPAIPHGNLKLGNVVFDERMNPHLAEFGLKVLAQSNKVQYAPTSDIEAGESNSPLKEELCMDVFHFGEIVLEILTNGRLTKGGEIIQSKPMESLLREICNDNHTDSGDYPEEIKRVLDVALLCTRTKSSDRPSMEAVLKHLTAIAKAGQTIN